MTFATQITIRMPAWAGQWLKSWPRALPDVESRMRAAIDLAACNVRHGSGGPFGALVVSEGSGELMAIGVNRVVPGLCSSAHAEIVALSLAQQRLEQWNLAEAAAAPLQLVTSCEPCAMCLGAIPWSGVRSVVCGATKDDAEAAGFDEGERQPDWSAGLERRGIAVVTGVLREEAAAVFEAYRRSAGVVYNP